MAKKKRNSTTRPARPGARSASGAGGRILRDAAWVARQLEALSLAAAKEAGPGELVLAGIKAGGAVIADRLAALLEKRTGKRPPVAHLDVTLYRDDLSRPGRIRTYRGTEMLCPIDDKTVILVDDVLYTGRTIRAALDLLMDFGRPRAVRLYVLVDRGGRELPIRPDVLGGEIEAALGERVEVRLKETGGADAVVLAPEK